MGIKLIAIQSKDLKEISIAQWLMLKTQIFGQKLTRNYFFDVLVTIKQHAITWARMCIYISRNLSLLAILFES